jgi:phosphotransferase system enzyme I (PtsI)
MQNGIAVSAGIEIGKALVYKPQDVSVDAHYIPPSVVEEEIEKITAAIDKSRTQLEAIRDNASESSAEIFEAHLMILDDFLFKDAIIELVKSELITAEYATQKVVEEYVTRFEGMENVYFKERAADMQDIGDRLIKNILGVDTESISEIKEEIILISRDLMPSDTAQINKEFVKAFAIDLGGRTCHTAIMAAQMEVPAVVGLGDFSENIKTGDTVIVDGRRGVVIGNPDDETIALYKERRLKYIAWRDELANLNNLPCETKGGTRKVEIAANIGGDAECENALDKGAKGVGLFRTEFLYMDRTALPTEEEQFEVYKSAVEQMGEYPVIFRTLDIGGDKKLPYLEIPEELNPFLGWRAIRICFDRIDIFKTQLRAILRASAFGKARIMFPMISNLEETKKAKYILLEAKNELESEGIAFDYGIEIGIMVEIPSAAVIADVLAKEVDFFSIGTNDLIQYVLAADRMNERISHLYDPFSLGILRLIKNVIDASHEANIWTGMCGEMASDPVAVPILLGLGLDEFSMTASSIPEVKQIIRATSYEAAKDLAERVMSVTDPGEIKTLADAFYQNSGVDVL